MNKTSELVDHAKFILGNAHTRIEPIRQGSNINPNDVWTTLDYIEAAQKKLTEAAELSLKAEARIEELEEMLKWYIEEDEIHEGDPENQYWIDGKHKAMKLLGMEIK